MRILFAMGVFACCGKPHVFAAAIGAREAMEQAMPEMLHKAEGVHGPCSQVMIGDMGTFEFAQLELGVHLLTNPDAVIAALEKVTSPEHIVADQLRKH